MCIFSWAPAGLGRETQSYPKDKAMNRPGQIERQFCGREKIHWNVRRTMRGQEGRRQEIYLGEVGCGTSRQRRQQSLQGHNHLRMLL